MADCVQEHGPSETEPQEDLGPPRPLPVLTQVQSKGSPVTPRRRKSSRLLGREIEKMMRTMERSATRVTHVRGIITDVFSDVQGCIERSRAHKANNVSSFQTDAFSTISMSLSQQVDVTKQRSHSISSRPYPSCPVLLHPTPLHPIPSCPIPSHPIPSHAIHPTPSQPTPSHPTPSQLTPSHPHRSRTARRSSSR